MTNTTRTWDNLILERRTEFGYAARRNRGSYSGTKVHRIISEYIIGLVDEAKEVRPDSLGYQFKKSRMPVLFSARPACGCTNGQHAARPQAHLTAATCSKC